MNPFQYIMRLRKLTFGMKVRINPALITEAQLLRVGRAPAESRGWLEWQSNVAAHYTWFLQEVNPGIGEVGLLKVRGPGDEEGRWTWVPVEIIYPAGEGGT